MHDAVRARCADVIATLDGKFVLIERLKYPLGLALPGGHIEENERPMIAAIREFSEETGLTLANVRFIMSKKGKKRDPRYTMSETCVYHGSAHGMPRDERGATKVVLLSKNDLLRLPPERFAFDHHQILMRFLG